MLKWILRLPTNPVLSGDNHASRHEPCRWLVEDNCKREADTLASEFE